MPLIRLEHLHGRSVAFHLELIHAGWRRIGNRQAFDELLRNRQNRYLLFLALSVFTLGVALVAIEVGRIVDNVFAVAGVAAAGLGGTGILILLGRSATHQVPPPRRSTAHRREFCASCSAEITRRAPVSAEETLTGILTRIQMVAWYQSLGALCPKCETLCCAYCYYQNGRKCPECGGTIVFFLNEAIVTPRPPERAQSNADRMIQDCVVDPPSDPVQVELAE